MEQLIQKYIRYFYTALIGGISVQLLAIIFIVLKGEIQWDTFILMLLSIVNIILLSSNMIHNKRQRFMECKINAKILRFTLALLIGFQALLCFIENFSGIMLINHLMTILIIEIILNYRIKSIDYLEKLADKFAKDAALDQKGE